MPASANVVAPTAQTSGRSERLVDLVEVRAKEGIFMVRVFQLFQEGREADAAIQAA
jgi:hypothetical protein